jgi:D-3-phosphoglycerate dehydrogenase
MISVTVRTAKGEAYAAGTIFGRQDPRIVRINKFTVEVIPEGRMFVMFNYDKPGVIGNIGTTLGQNGVNIARLHLSREQIDGQAMVVLSTDSVVSPAVIEMLRKLPHVISVVDLEM